MLQVLYITRYIQCFTNGKRYRFANLFHHNSYENVYMYIRKICIISDKGFEF